MRSCAAVFAISVCVSCTHAFTLQIRSSVGSSSSAALLQRQQPHAAPYLHSRARGPPSMALGLGWAANRLTRRSAAAAAQQAQRSAVAQQPQQKQQHQLPVWLTALPSLLVRLQQRRAAVGTAARRGALCSAAVLIGLLRPGTARAMHMAAPVGDVDIVAMDTKVREQLACITVY
jgi:hypothetical protein